MHSEAAIADGAGEAPASEHGPSAWRLGIVIALLLGLAGLAHGLGWTDRFSVEALREVTAVAGCWGIVAFMGVFCVGELLHVPGLVFVGAAVAAWGPLVGGAVAFGGALASVSFSFAFVRTLGGQALAHSPRPWVRRALGHLERRPVRTVALLRLVLILSPPLNMALAASSLRFRHYLLGSALGLAPPVGVFVLITAGVLGS